MLLPSVTKLWQNGYSALGMAMRSHPVLFSHIPQQGRIRKFLPDHIAEAEILAASNKGILPSNIWLAQHGYNSLIAIMRKYPESFSHITQERSRSTIEEHVASAKQLANDNNGTLPTYAWLRDNGPKGINAAMSARPELFEHLPQEKIYKSPEEHIRDAERITQAHGGTLPNAQWLEDNGFSPLKQAMVRYPQRFRHIQQRKVFRTSQEWLQVAKKLSKGNDGVLPNYGWLEQNGYGGLNHAIRSYPSVFKQLRQLRLRAI